VFGPAGAKAFKRDEAAWSFFEGGSVVRLLQNVLLVVGATALGVVACGLGLAFLALPVLRSRPGQDPSLNWGGGIAFAAFGICGGALGGVAGLVAAVRWIARRGSEPWGPMTWAGVALGLATALALRLAGVGGRLNTFGGLIEGWADLAVFLAAGGTLGGLLGGLVEPGRDRRDAYRRRKRRSRGGAG
jgi:hypothetical protein